MAKHTTSILEGLVGMIRGPANPKSGVAMRKVHLQPQPCLKQKVIQGWRGGKDRGVLTSVIQFDVVRKECDIRCRSFVSIGTESGAEGNDSGTGKP
jgi:hypothetical protein